MALIALIISTISLVADLVSLLTVNSDLLRERVTQFSNAISLEQLTGQTSNSRFLLTIDVLWPVHLVFFALLATITYYEFSEKIIPNAVTFPGMVLGIAFAAGFQDLNLLFSILGVVIGVFGVAGFNRLYRSMTGQDGIGGGAIKMHGMIGAFLGLPGLAITIVLNSLIFVSFALVTAFIRKDRFSLSQTYEIGPSMAIAAIITTIFIPLSS
jgi:prepilin signal peptidase PulO-like enzyme (type II secretory pathway)